MALSAILVMSCQLSGRIEDSDLTMAVRAGDVTKTRALLARGADPNEPAGVNGWPPLMHAVHKNELGTAGALIERGADINKGGPDGMTPLMMAAGYGNDEMVGLLLRYGAKPDVRTKDGANALDFALTGVSDIDKFTFFRCQDSTVSLLLRRNPDLHATARTSSRAWARMKRCVSSG